MTERRGQRTPTESHPRRFRSQLASLRLRSCDVEVFARLYGRTDTQAAEDLIGLSFNGGIIEDNHIGRKLTRPWYQHTPSTRRGVAEEIFLESFGEPSK